MEPLREHASAGGCVLGGVEVASPVALRPTRAPRNVTSGGKGCSFRQIAADEAASASRNHADTQSHTRKPLLYVVYNLIW